MKIKSLRFDDNHKPEAVLVELTVDEAAYLTKLTGQQTHHTANATMGGPGGGEANGEIYVGLTAYVFNPYYDNGVTDYTPATE